jgi:hypothetical protein
MEATTDRPSEVSQRFLRVGILLGNHIVEERVLRAHQPVTLGTSARCTFIVPAERPGPRWRLFEWRRGQCVLRWPATMSGRIAVGEKQMVLDSAGGTMVLPGRTRGKVKLGSLTVLFQLVSAPLLAKPRLPACVRGSVLARLDRPLAAFLALSLVTHLSLVLYLRSVDWPRRPDIERLAEDFRQVLIRRPPPMPKPTANGQKAETRLPKPNLDRDGQKPKPVAKAPTTADRRADLVEKVSKMGILAVLTARGSEPGRAIADLLDKGGVERLQEQALAGVTGIQVAGDGPGLAIRAGSGQGKLADVRGLASGMASIATVDIRGRDERRVPVVHTDRPIIEEGSSGQLDVEQLRREMRNRVGALRSCYERALKRTPQLSGKLILRFTIVPAGTVTGVQLESDSLDDADMASCVRRLALGWRFPAPQGGPMEVSFPFVFQSSGP